MFFVLFFGHVPISYFYVIRTCELMLGCVAEAMSTDIVIQEEEVEAVRWVPRAQVAEAVNRLCFFENFSKKNVLQNCPLKLRVTGHARG